MKAALAAALLAVAAGGAWGEALRTSPLPMARPGATPLTHPLARPAARVVRPSAPADAVNTALAQAMVPATVLTRSQVPRPRPARSASRQERMVSLEPARAVRAGPVGAICGMPDIIGQTVAPVPGRLQGCGVPDAVRVAEVAGVRLSRPAMLDCQTARALRNWVEGGVKPVVGRLGGGPARLEVAASFACRTINSRPGGSVSEHGKGKAIDISGLTLRNGQSIMVESGWRRQTEGEVLRRLHRAACGPFGTVLGPESDRFHQDHLHFDTKQRRSPYCR